MPIVDQLQEHVDRSDKQRKKRIDRLVRRIELAIVSLAQRINLEGLDSTGVQPIVTIGDAITELEGELTPEVAADLIELYEEELKVLIETYRITHGVNVFGAADADVVDALMDIQLDVQGKILNKHFAGINETIVANILTGQDINLNVVLRDFSGRIAGNVKTEVTTGLSVFGRTVNARKQDEIADSDDPHFMYIGSLDEITRQFCLAVLSTRTPPIYRLSEINKMTNNQIPNVRLTGGGYNCRHEWIMIPESRIREVRDDFKRFKDEKDIVEKRAKGIAKARREGNV